MSLAIAAGAVSGIQALSTIQNARFQADLTEQNNRASMREDTFAATERLHYLTKTCPE